MEIENSTATEPAIAHRDLKPLNSILLCEKAFDFLLIFISDLFSLRAYSPAGLRKMSLITFGTLWYLKSLDIWATTKPYFINVPQSALPENQRVSNEVSEQVRDVTIRNMRDIGSPNDIDLCGFSYKTHDFEVSTEIFKDPLTVRQHYIPKVEGWLQEITGAEFVHTLTSEVRDLSSFVHPL